MIRCPSCHGIGRTSSTRSEPDCIIRWHKCNDCGLSFTSTQKVDFKYCDNLKSQYIESIIESKDFKAAIKLLLKSLNVADVSWTYCSDLDILISSAFNNLIKSYDSTFHIDISVNKPNIYGVISLVSLPSIGGYGTKALIGQIRFDGSNWLLDLDLATINKINNDRKEK